MAYRLDRDNQTGNKSIVIDGFEKGIASSPYNGIGNIRNLNTTYYPGVAYSNYKRQLCGGLSSNVIDSYDTSNYSSTFPLYSGGSQQYIAQPFFNFKNTTFTTAAFYLSKTGSPTGTMQATLYKAYKNATGKYVTNITPSGVVNVLVVGGGGGGGYNLGGGGGAGGYQTNATLAVNNGSYSVTVGSGGNGGTSGSAATNGSNSIFSSITAIGGGAGGNAATNGFNGASGGGGGGSSGAAGTGGLGTAGQGNNGEGGTYALQAGGGGGGASAIGVPAASGGNGGAGTANSITGASVTYAGGGGGGTGIGNGGVGGGGSGGFASVGFNGTANTGGGGGGGANGFNGGSGGSGVVIIAYPTGTYNATGGTITTSGGNTIHTFTTSGTWVLNGPQTIVASSTINVSTLTGTPTLTNFTFASTALTANTVYILSLSYTGGSVGNTVNVGYGITNEYQNNNSLISTDGILFSVNNTPSVNNLIYYMYSTANTLMTNPVQKAISPAGLNYVLDDSGNIWKQSAVNSTTFNLLPNGLGRLTNGASGLAYWNNYLVVFGNNIIEFCGNGTGDSGITGSNWNNNTASTSLYSSTFYVNYTINANNLILATYPATFPRLISGTAIIFSTTGTLPAPLVAGTTYYALNVTTSNYITISATPGGSAIVFTTNGTGTHTFAIQYNSLPIGNYTNANVGLSVGSTAVSITSYVDPLGNTINGVWLGPTGIFNIIMPDGQAVAANFTYGSTTATLLSALIYFPYTAGTYSIQILTSNTFYRPYVSKVDGSLYFCNGQYVGRIQEVANTNIVFNPIVPSSYTVNFGATSIPEQFVDTTVDLCDLKNQLVIAGQKDIYTWDYVSAQASSPSPVGSNISSIINILNNIYILSGQKGDIYIFNGYSAQLLYKLPDFIAGKIDPVWSFGGIMQHRSKLFFQALVKDTSGNNILAGIFSVIVSPSALGETASGLVMESQNSYGLTPTSGALSNGVLIDNNPSANGNDSYYSAWSNGASTGGIDYNNTTPWDNFEPVIETDIIPVGNFLDKQTFSRIEFKLDRPMATGDSIRISWRPSLTDSYTLMGTTSTNVLSSYYPSNIQQAQWVQFKVEFDCATSGSSFIPLREIRLKYENR